MQNVYLKFHRKTKQNSYALSQGRLVYSLLVSSFLSWQYALCNTHLFISKMASQKVESVCKHFADLGRLLLVLLLLVLLLLLMMQESTENSAIGKA